MDELQSWLDENWDPDLTVGEWWERLGLSGWAAPILPADVLRQGPVARRRASRAAARSPSSVRSARPVGLGLLLAGADDRDARHAASRSSCTSATSSPAGRRGASCSASRAPAPTSPACTTRAIEDGDEWHRQRSEGVDVGRPDRRPGHAASPARTPTCRSTRASRGSRSTCTSRASRCGPLREMTGARDVQRGLPHRRSRRRRRASSAASTTGGPSPTRRCMFERSGLGRRWRRAVRAAWRRPARSPATSTSASATSCAGGSAAAGGDGRRRRRSSACAKLLVDLAKGNGKIDEPAIRQDLMRLHTLNELGRNNNLRLKAGARRRAATSPASRTSRSCR